MEDSWDSHVTPLMMGVVSDMHSSGSQDMSHGMQSTMNQDNTGMHQDMSQDMHQDMRQDQMHHDIHRDMTHTDLSQDMHTDYFTSNQVSQLYIFNQNQQKTKLLFIPNNKEPLFADFFFNN